MRTTRWAWPFAALLTLAPGPARAQQPQEPQPTRSEIEQRIRERFSERVRDELELSDEQLADLDEVVLSFHGDRVALARRHGALRRALRAAERQPVGDEQAARLLREMASVREEELRLFRAEMDGLLRMLSPSQVLRFYELREDLMDRVRRARDGARRRRGGDGGRGGPRP